MGFVQFRLVAINTACHYVLAQCDDVRHPKGDLEILS